MFTWNLQYVSKKRLEDTLYQFLVSDGEEKDVLIRIHTAIHTAEEAVDLAAFIKGIIPNAQILGTSTSAIISEGKLIHDQCIISITQMDEGKGKRFRRQDPGNGKGQPDSRGRTVRQGGGSWCPGQYQTCC